MRKGKELVTTGDENLSTLYRQPTQNPKVKTNKKIWRVDVGMSRAFGPLDQDEEETKNRKVQVLLIEDDNKFKILKEQ